MIYILLWIIDNIIPVLFWILIILGIAKIIGGFCIADKIDEDSKDKEVIERNYKYRRKGGYKVLYAIIFFILAALIPSEKTMYKMLGIYGIQGVIESKIGQKSLLLIDKKLDKALKDDKS